MSRKKKIISILAMTVVMLCLSLFRVENSVCCMFVSNRERGFPYPIVSITKGTDDLKEAQKVYSLSDLELLKQGWKLKVGPIFPSLVDIPFDVVFYLLVSWAVISVIERIKRIYGKK